MFKAKIIKILLVILKIIRTIIDVIAITIIINYIFPIYNVSGGDMATTLNDNDYIVISKYSSINNNDLIAFYQGKHLMLRRCIASQGDCVNIIDGHVYINNSILIEDYCKDYTYPGDIELPLTVKEKQYFVLSDQRDNSLDSRDSSIGLINEEDILGKVIFRIYPFQKIESD